ncbi:PREDICTED: dehydrogenase/reductase SDR family member 4-like isoform X1 [Cercocebus atys]|uniref:dehydrogenase/reductase SDR family member 4-like isoform X1 n=1 Tax=Cercocebus atys TaxID=9531 RepID=UPI0005F4D01E|nr:PREDICTED: dehydrogenase/reductase SDR family member 4-like isoform X1 [Cercocebus atys]
MLRPLPLHRPWQSLSLSTHRIGFAIARRLAQDGAHVVVNSWKQQNVDQAVATLQGEGLSVTGTVCHVGKIEDPEWLVATVSCREMGTEPRGRKRSQPDPPSLLSWTALTLDINVKAPALVTKAVVPEMEKRGGGSVVIVASIAAFSPSPGLSPYSVSKTALLGLTKTLAIELAPRNIRVNCLVPGLIKTSFSRMLCKDKEKEERMKEILQIRRLGEPEDCAGIVSFLRSEDASYITGETVVVGGGTPSRL